MAEVPAHEASHPLAGSERRRPDSHAHVGPLPDAEEVAISLAIRRKPGAPKLPNIDDWRAIPPAERRFFTPETYAERFGASPADIASVETFVRGQGMTVLRSHAGRRTVSVLGSAAQMNSAFGVELHRFKDPHAPVGHGEQPRTHRGFDGQVTLPAQLAGLVTGVFGLDDRHLGRPMGALGDPSGAGYPFAPNAAKQYNIPNSGAADQTIGVFAPQGTSGTPPCYLPSDISSYISGLPAGYTTQPTLHDVNCIVGTTTYQNNTSQVTSVTSVASANNAILELTQDISTSAALAQGATINVYFTAASEDGYLEFLNRVLLPDPGENQPTVLTFSFGIYLGDDAPGESAYTGIGSLSDTSSAAYKIDELLSEITAVGISPFIALGDWGSDNWYLLAPPNLVAPDGNQHVAFPATDPNVTACGGTVLGTSQEAAWSDAFSTTSNFGGDFTVSTNANSNFGSTGGGVSATFPAPSYQAAAGITGATDSAGATHSGRGVPDIAGHVGYNGYFVNGLGYNYVGTSCVAPFFAGMTAVLRSALGVKLGAFNTLLYDVGSGAFNDITVGDNDSHDTPANVASVISGYTGTTPDAAFFQAKSGWDACTGLGSIDGTKLLNGIGSLLYNPNFYFQVNKGSFGLDEVKITADFSSPTPFWLVLEGFTPNAVTSAHIKPTVTPSVSGVTIKVGAAQPEIATALDTPQRIYFPCSVSFAASAIKTIADGGIFPAPGSPPVPTQVLLLAPSITIAGNLLPGAETTLTLEPGADPFFANFATNGEFYLSQDLRVFTVCPGIPAQKAPIDGIALNASSTTSWDTNAAYQYIQALLNHLDATYADPTGTDPFTLFPDQTNALSGDSSVTPTQVDPAGPTENPPLANYNFAVAKVRLSGTPGDTSVDDVRVLFRLFASQTGDTQYQPLSYPSNPDSEGQPLEPLLGSGAVTIPFFATGNYEPNSDFGLQTDYSGTTVNNKVVKIGSSGEAWAYFGCYLNIYPTGNTITVSGQKQAVQTLLPSTHSCVVAQLVYDDAPYPAGPGVVMGPEFTDNFAQRNLQVTYSDNPGPASTHRIPQTFDTRPGPAPGAGQLENYPDEYMIDWGNTPAGATAYLYWPQVSSAAVLALADKFYSTHQLSAGDAHTISCKVPRGITCIPIPPGSGANYAGLFTVDLPAGVSAGQTFTITLRRVSTRPGATQPVPPPPPPPQPKVAGAAQAEATTGDERMRNWRYVVGSFAVKIPVTTAKVMLPAEEMTYSLLKWRLSQMLPTDRWIPVLQRYLGLIEGRIIGLNGNPNSITPSPWGPYGPPPKGGGERRGPHAATGKVNGVVYDRFGDFEGLHLLSETGHEHVYRSREREIEDLARFAWAERVVITVISQADHPETPERIILRRLPRPLD